MDLQNRLREAILFGDIAAAERLLDQGASVNKTIDSQFPVDIAIYNGEIDVALCLLRRGADLSLPPLPKPETRTRQADEISSWRTKFWFIPICRIALGMAISVGVSKGLSGPVVQSSTARHLREVLDFRTPLGLSTLSFITDTVLKLPSTDNSRSDFPRVPTLLCIYSLSHMLRGRARGVLTTLLSWNWRGFVGRASLDLCLRMTVACYQYFRRSIWKQEVPIYPGLNIVKSFVASKFSTERLALALLDHGLFSEELVPVGRHLPIEWRNGALFWAKAAFWGFNDAVRRLIILGFSVDTHIWSMSYHQTALMFAASSGQLCVVETLLEHGANVEGAFPNVTLPRHLDFGSSISSTPLMECLLASNRYDDDDSKARHQIVKSLIKNGAAVDITDHRGKTPLTVAAQNCPIETVKLLLQHSNAPSQPDKWGETLAHYATSRGDAVELLELLRERDRDLETPDENGYTPLLLAICNGQISAAKQLLSLGANLLAKTKDGFTALELVSAYWSRGLLLEIGIDVNAHDKEIAQTRIFDKQWEEYIEKCEYQQRALRSYIYPHRES